MKKRVAICGTIGAGKSRLLKDYCENYDDLEVFYETPDPAILARYYKYLNFLSVIIRLGNQKSIANVFLFVLVFILCYFTKSIIIVLIFVIFIIQLFVSLYWIEKFCQGVCFDTQIYFLSLRKKSERNKKKSEKIVGEDRSFFEDKIFPLTQLNYGFLTKTQFEIYDSFYKEYVKDLDIPDLFVYLDVTPETAFRNVQLRIKESNNKTNECLITLDYLQKLGKQYDDWKKQMIEDHKEKFVVVDNNKEFFTCKKLNELIKN